MNDSQNNREELLIIDTDLELEANQLLSELEDLIQVSDVDLNEDGNDAPLPVMVEDILGSYLVEIRQYPLLTPIREFIFGMEIDAARLMEEFYLEFESRDQCWFPQEVIFHIDRSLRDLTNLSQKIEYDIPDIGWMVSEFIIGRLSGNLLQSETLYEWLQGIGTKSADEIKIRRLAREILAGMMVLPIETIARMSTMLSHINGNLPDDSSVVEMVENLTATSLDRENLIERAQDAADRLTLANLRLAFNVANRYRGKGIPIMDLVQEANIGLLRAVKKYDPCRGYRFSTYATWWIRQAVTRYIANSSRIIRLPVHIHERINKVMRTRDELFQELGREPDPMEISEKIEDLPPDKIELILNVVREPLSLDHPIGTSNDAPFGDFISDHGARDPFEIIAMDMDAENIRDALNDLDTRDMKIMMIRYGFNDGVYRTLEEVGNIFGITRERVRQIEQRAKMEISSKFGDLFQ